MHVDQFIDDHRNDDYARWVLLHFRLPADLQLLFRKYMPDARLFCTWQGRRYRVTGASRMGDVWLIGDFSSTGYDHRVDIAECSEWSPTVNLSAKATPADRLSSGTVSAPDWSLE